MCNHVYDAEFVRAVSDNKVELLVDLGFDMRIQWQFEVFGITKDQPYRRFLINDLLQTDKITAMRMTSLRKDNIYYADISYETNGLWYNLTDVLTGEQCQLQKSTT